MKKTNPYKPTVKVLTTIGPQIILQLSAADLRRVVEYLGDAGRAAPEDDRADDVLDTFIAFRNAEDEAKEMRQRKGGA